MLLWKRKDGKARLVQNWFLDGTITGNACEIFFEDMWLDLENGTHRTENDLY